MEKYKKILFDALENELYYNNEDLRINKKYGYMLSRNELDLYLHFKDTFMNDAKEALNLKTFNSKNIYYYHSKELKNLLDDYLTFFLQDLEIKNSTIVSENYNEMILSTVASELDGTLKIEGVNTTRKKIIEIMNDPEILDSNEQIIYNMIEGYKFVNTKPEFTKENLLKLYKLLSYKSLKLDDEIIEYYRKDMVQIGSHDGCPIEKINDCMDSLFEYVNENLDGKNIFLPFIVHYYILYIHPYMDFNGRTARMCSIWISLLTGKEAMLPAYLSEAINDDKTNYYKAIDNSRNSHNDLTYFLTYLLNLANNYHLVYKNVSSIKNDLALMGESLTNTEAHYLKRIIINQKRGWFNYKGFIEFCNIDITKQGAFKILNNFCNLNILKAKINSKNEKIFILNENIIKYEIKN